MELSAVLQGFGGYGGYSPVLVGDLDGDTKPELVTIQSDFRNNSAGIIVFEGGSLARFRQIPFGESYGTPGVSFGYASGALAIARIPDASGRMHGMLFVVCGTESQKLLLSYEYSGALNLQFKAQAPLKYNLYGNPGVADLDADGKAEVYVGCEVFDALSLQSLGVGEGLLGRHLQHDGALFRMSVAADVLPQHEGLELVCGNQIYGLEKKQLQLLQTIGTPHEGSALVADLDADGKPEILVRGMQGTLSLYAPAQNKVVFVDAYNMYSYPTIGDVDGDGQPEIVGLRDKSRMVAYKYNAATGRLSEFWTITHSDASGQTLMTMFDFNGDGKEEVVYRDESLLRIINGSGRDLATGKDTLVDGLPVAYNLASYPVLSLTKSEYPVVADMDNDGEAEIIVPGVVLSADKYDNPSINIFKSKQVRWMPARPVWNQYLYDPVLVGDDTSVNPHPANKWCMDCGRWRPLNSVLQQTQRGQQ